MGDGPRKAVALLIIAAFVYGVFVLFTHYKTFEAAEEKQSATAGQRKTIVPENDGKLPGLPPQYEASLEGAKRIGPSEVARWLRSYGRYCTDPRKAEIELDYATSIYRTDPETAKQVFEGVRKRIPADSSLYPRIKELENAYR